LKTMVSLNWTNVDTLCAGVRFGTGVATLDLSDVTSLEPFALIYLGMVLRFHCSQGRELQVVMPQSQEVRRYLSAQNFWERFNVDPRAASASGLRRLTNETSLSDIVDIEKRPGVAEEITEAVLRMLRGNGVRVNTRIVAELIGELVDNFAQHSEGQLAGFMAQCYRNPGRLVVAIGDCGIGIRQSLSSIQRFRSLSASPHWEVAAQAFEPLVTRKAEGGTGLTDVRDAIIEAGGHLVLSTGNGYVQVYQGVTRAGQMQYDLPGVQIELTFYEEE
jgi:hypothetical protein